MPAPVLPDAKQLAITYLGDMLPGVTVADQTPPEPAFTQSLPLVRVLRIGGPADLSMWGGPADRDNPRFSVDVYAADPVQAWQVAQQVRAVWQDMPGYADEVGEVTGVSEETGPQDRPEEPNTGVTRVGMTLGMSVRPPRQTS